jgi:hypothetical protein
VQAGDREKVGQPGLLEEKVGVFQPPFVPQDQALEDLLGGRGKALGEPRPKGGPGVGQGREAPGLFHVKHALHPLGQEPGPLVKPAGVAPGLGRGQVAPEVVDPVLEGREVLHPEAVALPPGEPLPDGQGSLHPKPVRGLRDGEKEAPQEDENEPQEKREAPKAEAQGGQEEKGGVEEAQSPQEAPQAQTHAGGRKGSFHGLT